MAGLQSDATSDDYYKILGVPRLASEAAISKAYRKLALKHHPDKNPESKEKAEQKFKEISEAYSILGDEEKRKMYDLSGKDGIVGGGGQAHSASHHMGGMRFTAEDADRIFQMFFSGASEGPAGFGMSGGMRGADMRMGSIGGFDFDAFATDIHNVMGLAPGAIAGSARARAGQGKQQRQTAATDPCVIPRGTPVVLVGLAKAQQHNGKTGEIQRFDAEKCRYDVCVDNGELQLIVQPHNIVQLLDAEITGLTEKPELNGKRGHIFNFEVATGRYMMLLDSPNVVIALRPASCILQKGTRVVFRNVSSKPDLNDEMGIIVAVDQVARRYEVRCRKGGILSVKFDKVVC